MPPDFDHYKQEHPVYEKQIERDEKIYKLAEQLLDLKDHPGMKRLETELITRIERINNTLLRNCEMTEVQRARLLEGRECWLWLLRHFANAEENIKNITNKFKKYDQRRNYL